METDELDIIKVVTLCLPILLKKERIPQHTSVLTGALYYEELLNSNSMERFRNCFRMDKPTFFKLLTFLKQMGGLVASKRICEGQKLAILIHTLVGHSIRQTSERWQHSASTISLIVHEVCNCFMRVQTHMFVKPEENVVPFQPNPD